MQPQKSFDSSQSKYFKGHVAGQMRRVCAFELLTDPGSSTAQTLRIWNDGKSIRLRLQAERVVAIVRFQRLIRA